MKIKHIIGISLLIAINVACSDDFGYDIKSDSTDEAICFTPKLAWQSLLNDASSTRSINNPSVSDIKSTNTQLKEVSEYTRMNEYSDSDNSSDGHLISIIAFENTEGNHTDSLFLHIYEDDMPSISTNVSHDTRGTLIDSINLHDSFSVTAIRYEGNWKDKKHVNFFHNEKFIYDRNSDEWIGDQTYNWPGHNDSIRFYGVMPYGSVELSDYRTTTPPTFDYAIPNDISRQIDLLATRPLSFRSNHNKIVELGFEHILSAIRFQEDDDMCLGTISKISIDNVFSSGSYEFESGKWINLGEPQCYELAFEDGYEIKGSEGAFITPNNGTFFMIPSDTYSTNPLRLSLTHITHGEYDTIDTDTRRKLSTSLNINLKSGKIYTLKLSTKSIKTERILTCENGTPPDLTFNIYDNNTYTMDFSTYAKISRNDGDVSYKRLGCTLNYFGYNSSTGEYDIPLESAPEWIEFNQVNGRSCDSIDGHPKTVYEYRMPMKNAILNRYKENKEKLQSKSYGTVTTPYDLSVNPDNGNQESANCYIVNGYGHFKIPVTYGNGIINGKINSNSLSSMASTTKWKVATLHFVGAYKKPDGEINSLAVANTNTKSPFISDILSERGMTNPINTELIWETRKGLITDLKLSDDNHYISFNISKDRIEEGNALISLKNEYGYLWSWHIWVTPHTGEDDVTSGGVTYQGILGARDISYEVPAGAEKFRIEVTLDKENERDEDKTLSFLCIPPPENNNKLMYIQQPNYQFGRPTPLAPDGTIYDKDGNEFKCLGYEIVHDFEMTGSFLSTSNISNILAQINYTIFYPQFMNIGKEIFTKSAQAWDECYGIGNLWFAQDPSSPKKTAYDPCPRGYRVMKYEELSILKNALANNIKDLNTNYPYTVMLFDSNDNNKSILFPWTVYAHRQYQNPSSSYLGWWIIDNQLDVIKMGTNLTDDNIYTAIPNLNLYTSSGESVRKPNGIAGWTIIPVKE